MRQLFLVAVLGCMLILGCSGNANAPSNNDPIQDQTPAPPTTADDWRMGDSVLAVMGDVQGRIIADLYAGDGYYTWKLIDAGARVLAIDDDPAKVAALMATKRQRGIGDDRLIIRLVKPGDTGLIPDEADAALITREISTLGDREAWFKRLRSGLRGRKQVFIVNFLPVQTPTGPPLDQRMDFNTVTDELNAFGFTDVGTLYQKIPYRFIIFASIPPEDQR